MAEGKLRSCGTMTEDLEFPEYHMSKSAARMASVNDEAESRIIIIIITRAPVDVFSKKHFWVGQGPIDKIGRAARLPPKGPAGL